MNKNLKIIIFIGLGILIVLLVLVIMTVASKPKGLTIKNLGGKEVSLPDFYKTAVVNYGNVPVLEDNSKYTIQYDTKNNVFQIYLNVLDSEDIEPFRLEAEKTLAAKLNRTTAQLCELPIVEVIPDDGRVTLENYNLSVSVCNN